MVRAMSLLSISSWSHAAMYQQFLRKPCSAGLALSMTIQPSKRPEGNKLLSQDTLFRILNNGLERRGRLLPRDRDRRLHRGGQGDEPPEVQRQRLDLAPGERARHAA